MSYNDSRRAYELIFYLDVARVLDPSGKVDGGAIGLSRGYYVAGIAAD